MRVTRQTPDGAHGARRRAGLQSDRQQMPGKSGVECGLVAQNGD
jgi:hypothetical protein